MNWKLGIACLGVPFIFFVAGCEETSEPGIVNISPTLDWMALQVVNEEEPKELILVAEDPNPDQSLLFCKQSGPQWAEVQGQGKTPGKVYGKITLSPGPQSVGKYQIVVRVTDELVCPGTTSFDEKNLSVVVLGKDRKFLTDGEESSNPQSRTNESIETSSPIELDEPMVGFFGAYDFGIDPKSFADDSYDVDTYWFHATAGEVLQIVADSAGGPANPVLRLRSMDYGTPYLAENIVPAAGLVEKTAFIPTTGNYALQLFDLQQWLYWTSQGKQGSPFSGNSHGYIITVSRSSPTPSPIGFPTENNLAVQVENRNYLGLFEINPGRDLGIQLNVYGLTTLGQEKSSLDMVVYVFDTELQSLVFYNESADDSASSAGNHDARAHFVARTDSPQWIVVDFHAPTDVNGVPLADPKLYYEMNVQTFDPTLEAEPNGYTNTARSINPSGSYQDKIDDPSVNGTDFDGFNFFCNRGESYRVTMTRNSGELIPAFSFYMLSPFPSGDLGWRFFKNSPNRYRAPEVSTEFLCETDGEIFIWASDQANLLGPSPRGGSDYGYQLRVEPVIRATQELGTLSQEVTPITDAPTNPGQIRWVKFTASDAIVLRLAENAYYADPILRLFKENGYEPATELSGKFISLLVDPGTYWLSIQDGSDYPISSELTYTVEAFAGYPALEHEDNNSYTTAQQLRGPLVLGQLTESDVASAFDYRDGGDWYAIDGLSPGTSLHAHLTYPSSQRDDVNTVLECWVLGSQGLELLAYDYSSGEGGFSRLTNMPIRQSQVHYLRVRPSDGEKTSQGRYLLAVSISPCGYPSSLAIRPNQDGSETRMVINELGADPVGDPTPEGLVKSDWNRDGQIEERGDEFIEWINTGEIPLDLGGLMLKDNSTVLRHVFSCGTLLTPQTDYVLFGREPKDPELFGKSRTVGCTNGPKSGLGLDNSSDVIGVFAPGQLIYNSLKGWQETSGHILKFAYSFGSSNDNSSWQRCWTGQPGELPDITQCDQGDAYYLTKELSRGEYTATPGLKANQYWFVISGAETCKGAMRLTESITLKNQSLVGFRNDFDQKGAYADADTSGACGILSSSYDYSGPDAVYVVEPSQAGSMSLSVRPQSEFDVALVVTSNCERFGKSCLGAADENLESGEETLQIPVEANTTYYVIVDSWSWIDYGGSYEFQLELQP